MWTVIVFNKTSITICRLALLLSNTYKCYVKSTCLRPCNTDKKGLMSWTQLTAVNVYYAGKLLLLERNRLLGYYARFSWCRYVITRFTGSLSPGGSPDKTTYCRRTLITTTRGGHWLRRWCKCVSVFVSLWCHTPTFSGQNGGNWRKY